MIGNDETRSTAENYRLFARLEARGRSPIYEQLTEAVAADPEVLALIDSLDDLGAVVADVPSGATLVIFHSAVLTYVPPEHRDGFATQVAKLGAVWIANEGPGVLAGVRRLVPQRELAEHRGHFLLSRDGDPVAWTDPHGSWFLWRGDRTHAT